MKWIDYRRVQQLNFGRDNGGVFPEHATVVLSKEEHLALLELGQNISTNPYVFAEQESFVASAKDLVVRAFHKATLDRIRAEIDSGFGAVLIRGLPSDPSLPDTPTRGGSLPPDYKKTFVSEALLLALGCLTGSEPFNYRQEGRGTAPLIDNVVSVRELKSVKGSGGYENNFPFHCESAWHRKRPDYLVLLGIREDSTAKTLVFSTEMFDSSVASLINDQGEGLFRVRGPELYGQMEENGIPLGTAKYVTLNPIESAATGIRLNINFNGTDCANDAAVKWLSKLEAFIEDKAVATVLGPASALILNNHRTCHTRNGFSPSFNGDGRWFLRGYFKKDLWARNPAVGTQLCSERDLIDLMKLGWMNETGDLTPEFFKYIQQPDLIKSLGEREAQLAPIAFHFTPIEWTRIV